MAIATGRTLAELERGQVADVFVLVEAASARRTKDGDVFYVLEVSDLSGRALVRVFADQKAFEPCRVVERGDVVKLRIAVEKTAPLLEGKASALKAAEADEASLSRVFGPLRAEAAPIASGAAAVAFDVETTPRLDLYDLPERERVKFARWAMEDARRETGEDRPPEEAIEESVRKVLSLNPLTNRIVSIALRAHPGGAEIVLVAPPGSDGAEAEELEELDLEPPAIAVDERELLRVFWGIARRARRLVGFNSRRFDAPVLLTRSALLGVPASVELLQGRFDREARHLDLLDVLAGHGAAADRRISLELAAYAFGIPAKSSGHGSEVARLVAEGAFPELAEYNLEDARATAELYAKLAGTWF